MAASVRIIVQTDGAALDRIIHGLRARAENLSPFFEQLKAELLETEAARFAAEGAIDGEAKWQDLATATARFKAKHFPGRPILQRSGEMLTAVLHPTEEITAHSMTLTVDNAYAIYHASSQPRESNLPRRQFFVLTAKEKSRIVTRLRNYLAGLG